MIHSASGAAVMLVYDDIMFWWGYNLPYSTHISGASTVRHCALPDTRSALAPRLLAHKRQEDKGTPIGTRQTGAFDEDVYDEW